MICLSIWYLLASKIIWVEGIDKHNWSHLINVESGWWIHQVLYTLYIWICLKFSRIMKNKSFYSFPLLALCNHSKACTTSVPLFLSERWGWLLTGLGSPCVAQRVWAIPRCTSNSISKSISCCSGDKIKISILNYTVEITLDLNIIITVLLNWNIPLLKLKIRHTQNSN